MKLELYKPYKTRGGHKAVVVETTEYGHYGVWHSNDRSGIWVHSEDGQIEKYDSEHRNDIISEWKEPRTFEAIVDVYNNGHMTICYAGPAFPLEQRIMIASKKITITEGEGL